MSEKTFWQIIKDSELKSKDDLNTCLVSHLEEAAIGTQV